MNNINNEIVVPPWFVGPPTKPGIYWFYANYISKHETRYRIYIVKKRYDGKLYVSNVDRGDWGPDGQLLALDHSGYWLEVEQPEEPIIIVD